MKYYASHARWLVHYNGNDSALVVGVAGGRVSFAPTAKWLYSIRLMLLVAKVELLWTTGETR